MSERIKRKRGGQKGNQNARKHGYYSKILTPAQQETIPAAAAVLGIDREIAILRTKIASILANDPQNIHLLTLALSSLARLVRTQQRLNYDYRQLSDSLNNCLPGHEMNDSCSNQAPQS